MYIYGSGTTSWQKGTVIEGNEIKDYYLYAMLLYYSDSVQVIGNYIHDNVNTYSYGIYCYYINNAYRIIGNKVDIISTAGSTCYGIRDSYGNYYSYNPTPTGYGLVANNMISINGGTGSYYGIYSYYCRATEYYYNSVYISGGSTSARCLYQYNTTSNTTGQTYKNNIFVNTGPGYAAYFNTPTMVVASDYNNYYTTGSNFVYWSGAQSNLAALQTASGKDANSLSIMPSFTSNTDLHLTTTTLSGKGTPITAVTVDIDSTLRSTVAPTIGAHELPLLPFDVGVFNITAPTQNAITNEGATVPLTVVVKNFGTDTVFGMNIEYSVNNGTPVNQAYNDTLLPNATDIVNLVSFTAPG